MSQKPDLPNVMRRAGFADTDTGPFVTEVRASMARKQADGLVSMSPGTWAGGPFWEIDPEVRARELLAMEWAMERGHFYRQECIDPPIYWQYNLRDRKRRLVVKWKRVPDWFGDRWRATGMRYRIWRDRNIVNPYSRADYEASLRGPAP